MYHGSFSASIMRTIYPVCSMPHGVTCGQSGILYPRFFCRTSRSPRFPSHPFQKLIIRAPHCWGCTVQSQSYHAIESHGIAVGGPATLFDSGPESPVLAVQGPATDFSFGSGDPVLSRRQRSNTPSYLDCNDCMIMREFATKVRTHASKFNGNLRYPCCIPPSLCLRSILSPCGGCHRASWRLQSTFPFRLGWRPNWNEYLSATRN